MMLSIMFLLFLVLISFAIGRRLLKLCGISFDTELEEFVFSTGIGLGIVSYLTLSLGLLGLLYRSSCLILFAVLFCFALWELWKMRSAMRSAWRKFYTDFPLKSQAYFEYGLLIILFIYVFASLLSSLLPPTDWDSLVYHLSVPKLWIKHHKVIHIPYIPQSEYHLTIETLYALGMVLADDTSACLIVWMTSTLLILTIFSFCRRYLSLRVGLLGAVAFYCTPLVSALVTRPMVDIPVAYYADLGIYALAKYVDRDDRRMLVLAGVTCGLAAATKHLGVIPFIVLFVGAVIVEVKKHRGILGGFGRIVLLGLAFSLVVAPWIVKSYINTGNLITNSRYASLISSSSKGEDTFTSPWIGKRLLGYITNFLRFLIMETLFQRTESRTLWSIGTFPLAFVPCLILVKKIPTHVKYVLAFSIGGLILFSTLNRDPNYAHFVRFSTPVYIGLFIAGAYSAYWLMDNYRCLTRFIQVIILSALFFNIIPLAKLTYNALPVVIRLETKEHYLSRKFPTYDVIAYANHSIDSSSKILTMDVRGYYFDKPYETKLSVRDVIGDVRKLVERFKRNGITHLFCNENFTNTGYEPLPEELRSYLTLVYSKNGACLYKFEAKLCDNTEH